MTVRRYLTRVRVEVAKDLLERTDEKLATVAAHVGFFDASHLARVFRKSTGRSPRAYRHAPQPRS
jgi:two-component system response regulator YesN